jgi:hypothetical protein
VNEIEGVKHNYLTENDEYSPTPAEMRIIEVSLNPEHAGKSITERCQLADVSRETWYKSFRKPEFNELVNKTSLDLIRDGLGDALAALKKSAANPSPKANPDRRLLFELAGVSKVADGDKIMIVNVGQSE